LKGIASIGFTALGMDVPQFVSTFQLMKDEMYTAEIQKINFKKPFFSPPQEKYISTSFKIYCINFGVSCSFQILPNLFVILLMVLSCRTHCLSHSFFTGGFPSRRKKHDKTNFNQGKFSMNRSKESLLLTVKLLEEMQRAFKQHNLN